MAVFAAVVQVDECNSNRLKMMAEAADSSTAVKVLAVKVLPLRS